MENFRVDILNYPVSGGTVQYRINSGVVQTATVVGSSFTVTAADGSTAQIRISKDGKVSPWSDTKSLDVPVDPGQSLFDVYKTRVESFPEFGSVQNYAATLELFNTQVEQSLRADLLFQISARAGNRLPSGSVNKAYSLDASDNDALQTTASRQPSILEGGYLFDGTYLQTLEGVSLVNNFTVNGWVKKRVADRCGFFVRREQFNLNFAFSINLNPDNIQYAEGNLARVGLSTYNTTYNTALAVEQWQMLTISKQSNVIRIYIDGVLVHTDSGASSALFDSTVPVLLSAYNSGSPVTLGNSIQDDLRIYTKVLTATEVQAIYNNTKGFYGIS